MFKIQLLFTYFTQPYVLTIWELPHQVPHRQFKTRHKVDATNSIIEPNIDNKGFINFQS